LDELIADHIYHLELGEIQEHKGMSVFPLYNSGDDTLYITLTEALDADLLKITELDNYGSVPELKVINQASVPVLLLDGEELAGAKQNRVLNTTILLKENSETIIPVSCTEQGRWSYNSLEFTESGNVASYRVRRHKSASVNKSLKNQGEFRSDQRMVWEGIDEISRQSRVKSSTRAMQDVYQSQEEDLEEYIQSFPVQDGQMGLLVMLNGDVMGLDILSSSIAYLTLHRKLLKSYALDVILMEGEVENGFNGLDKAKSFLDEARLSIDEKHKSVGYGWDHRLEGPGILGSSLTYQQQVIHTALFKDPADMPNMSSYRQRRNFRM
jgi:hypothetical protein